MMRWWRGLLERVRVLVRRGRFEAELDDELQFHLEESTRRNLRRGMSPGEAKRAARRSMGRTVVEVEPGFAKVVQPVGVHRAASRGQLNPTPDEPFGHFLVEVDDAPAACVIPRAQPVGARRERQCQVQR